jgi:molybdate transport system substrate-binding protein
MMNKRFIPSVLAVMSISTSCFADQVIVAVANNFYGPMQQLSQDFESTSDHTIDISTGSTGQLYAQITNGAPFDLFFAADTVRPQKLVKSGLGYDEFTYAKGALVLWSETPDLNVKASLESQDFNHLAMANPRLAPYGLAAQQTLEKLGLYDKLAGKVVLGKGLNPTYQFVVTGNAALGFIAKSQVFKDNAFKLGSVWEVPAEYYQEIKQDAVTLTQGKTNTAAQAFLDYLKTSRAQMIISSYGYK